MKNDYRDVCGADEEEKKVCVVLIAVFLIAAFFMVRGCIKEKTEILKSKDYQEQPAAA